MKNVYNQPLLFAMFVLVHAGVVLLSEACPNLRFINIRQCRLVTDMGMIMLSQNCPSIKIL